MGSYVPIKKFPPHAKSRDFRSKPAQFRAKNVRKQPQSTLQNCTDAAHHLQHIQKHFSVHRALAAHLPRAKTVQKSTRTRAIFMRIFVIFSRATHRTIKMWCTSPLHNIQRPPAMIAHVLRSMRASAAPKSR